MPRFAVFVMSFMLLAGCAATKEAFKGVAGVSTKVLYDTRDDAAKKTFACDYNSCYGMVKAALLKQGAYIYAEDKAKHMIAVYLSNEDTTPVGIFLTAMDAGNTRVEVSSGSAYAKEVVSIAVFSDIDKALKKQEGAS